MTNRKLLTVTVYCLLFTLFGGCSKKQPKISLPEIPERVLRDPSGMAFDGFNFYLADWTNAGLIEIEPSGKNRWIALGTADETNLRLIQVIAISRGKLIVETNDGELHLVEINTEDRAPKKLHQEKERKAGSLLCWDGIYLWTTDNGMATANVLFANGDLAAIPSSERGLSGALGDGVSALGFACGWENTYLLAKEGQDLWLVADAGRLSGAQKHLWTNREYSPLAIALKAKNSVIALCKDNVKPSRFKLLPWTPKDAHES